VHELWNWNRCKTQIRSLRGRLGFSDADTLDFLGLSLNQEDGSVRDLLMNEQYRGSEVGIFLILCGYAKAKFVPETSRLISFKQLSGGQEYYKAFMGRAIQPLAGVFGSNPQMLVEAAKLLGGTHQTYGDQSVKIYSLPLVPLTIILWAGTAEFPASADILFDSNANDYLTTEELAVLGGLTTMRLKSAVEALKRRS
jgi:hypothetical protein